MADHRDFKDKISHPDSWRVFRIIAEFVDGFETLTEIGPSVSFFGSSRIEPVSPYYNMAIDVSAFYRGTITPELRQIASTEIQTMRKLGVSIGQMHYPSTLPIGSGNEHDTGYSLWSHFYPETEAQILAETTGSISLESLTNTVANQ